MSALSPFSDAKTDRGHQCSSRSRRKRYKPCQGVWRVSSNHPCPLQGLYRVTPTRRAPKESKSGEKIFVDKIRRIFSYGYAIKNRFPPPPPEQKIKRPHKVSPYGAFFFGCSCQAPVSGRMGDPWHPHQERLRPVRTAVFPHIAIFRQKFLIFASFCSILQHFGTVPEYIIQRLLFEPTLVAVTALTLKRSCLSSHVCPISCGAGSRGIPACSVTPCLTSETMMGSVSPTG